MYKINIGTCKSVIKRLSINLLEYQNDNIKQMTNVVRKSLLQINDEFLKHTDSSENCINSKKVLLLTTYYINKDIQPNKDTYNKIKHIWHLFLKNKCCKTSNILDSSDEEVNIIATNNMKKIKKINNKLSKKNKRNIYDLSTETDIDKAPKNIKKKQKYNSKYINTNYKEVIDFDGNYNLNNNICNGCHKIFQKYDDLKLHCESCKYIKVEFDCEIEGCKRKFKNEMS